MSSAIRNNKKSGLLKKRKTDKGKPGKNDGPVNGKKRKIERINNDNDITSEESDNGESEFNGHKGAQKRQPDSPENSDNEEETGAEKRTRLIREAYEKITEQVKQITNDGEAVFDAVADRLNDDVLQQRGKLCKDLAHLYAPPTVSDITVCKWRKLSVVTCIIITPDDRFIFCGTKSSSIIKWSVETGLKVDEIAGEIPVKKVTSTENGGSEVEKPKRHTGHVLCLAISSDGKYLVSGGRDGLILVWNPETCQYIHTFKKHKRAVTGLAFEKDSTDMSLFSCSEDKNVVLWNLREMAFVEVLSGHESGITGIDCLAQARAITAGGSDHSVRLWRVATDSHALFHGHTSSIDCISYIDDQHFFTGSEDNSLAIWSTMKKKPWMTVKDAHSSLSPGGAKCWISAVAALPYSDLLVSGSSDGCLRFWETGKGRMFIKPLFTLPLDGCINSLKFSSNGLFLVAGVGREHRLGRWQSLKQVKDSVCIIRLNRKEDTTVYMDTSSMETNGHEPAPFILPFSNPSVNNGVELKEKKKKKIAPVNKKRNLNKRNR